MTSLLNIRRRVASIRDTVCRDIEGELVRKDYNLDSNG